LSRPCFLVARPHRREVCMRWEFAPCNGNFWDKAGTSCSDNRSNTAFCGVIHRSNPTNTRSLLTQSQYVVIGSERGLFPPFPNFFRSGYNNRRSSHRKTPQTARKSCAPARSGLVTHDFP
jgi:hypothetical protein